MTLRSTREQFAAALDTVAGVTGHVSRPSVYAEGDAWPLLGPGDRDAGDAFMITWAVRVFVPQDEVAAADWWDQHWDEIYYALKPFGFVDRFAPVAVQASGGDLLMYEITVRTGE